MNTKQSADQESAAGKVALPDRKSFPSGKNVFFVSGIDTGIGKSYATGFLAREWNRLGLRTVSQKLVQTGNQGFSEDIDLHRRLMGTGMLEEDRSGLTMPEIFSYPCSPHLASEIDRRAIDFESIETATRELSDRYDAVLLEGAGGLMVPLTREILTIDYIAGMQYPLVLVSSGRLGSINHTLLALEAIRQRHLRLYAVVYNLYQESTDHIIRQDTESFLENYLHRNFPGSFFVRLPVLDN